MELAAGRAQVDRIAYLNAIVQVVGDQPHWRVRRGTRLPFGADAKIVQRGPLRETVIARRRRRGQLAKFDAHILTGFEAGQRPAVRGLQIKRSNNVALRNLAVDDEASTALPTAGNARLLLVDGALTVDEDLG